MSSRILVIFLVAVLGLATLFYFFKGRSNKEIIAKPQTEQEIKIENLAEKLPQKSSKQDIKTISQEKVTETKVEAKKEEITLSEAESIDKLYAFDSSKLPLVETVTYTSRVPWLNGRPAWIADYASHYQTTRHFIARSLNRKPDYFTQKVAPGDRFNVLKKNVSFYLLIDLSRSKMWFYGIDDENHKKYLLKTYKVGLGRKDSKKPSSCLTPIGKYQLGSKVAIYRPGTMGYFQDRQIEMIRVFGTRWMPFEKEIANCSDNAKGYGIHGAPWRNDDTGLVEEREKIGKYDSDGCIRLFSEDIEEIFAIVISKPTIVELVNDFKDANYLESKSIGN